MIRFDCRNVSDEILGQDYGLDLEKEFGEYAPKIERIVTELNLKKDKPGQWLQWMNLGYNEETVWYVKEYAAMVEGRFDNVLVLGIGGSALGGMAVCEALLKPYWNSRFRSRFWISEDRDHFWLPALFLLSRLLPCPVSGSYGTR